MFRWKLFQHKGRLEKSQQTFKKKVKAPQVLSTKVVFVTTATDLYHDIYIKSFGFFHRVLFQSYLEEKKILVGLTDPSLKCT